MHQKGYRGGMTRFFSCSSTGCRHGNKILRGVNKIQIKCSTEDTALRATHIEKNMQTYVKVKVKASVNWTISTA